MQTRDSKKITNQTLTIIIVIVIIVRVNKNARNITIWFRILFKIKNKLNRHNSRNMFYFEPHVSSFLRNSIVNI